MIGLSSTPTSATSLERIFCQCQLYLVPFVFVRSSTERYQSLHPRLKGTQPQQLSRGEAHPERLRPAGLDLHGDRAVHVPNAKEH